MSLNVIEFLGLLGFSALLVMWHSYWKRQNLRFIKEVGGLLERVLKPGDQNYTNLGGVIGFYAEYETKAYGKVKAVFTTLPRQSLLYLPLALLLGRRDRLEVLLPAKRHPSIGELRGVEVIRYDDNRKALFIRLRVKRRHISETEETLRKVTTGLMG